MTISPDLPPHINIDEDAAAIQREAARAVAAIRARRAGLDAAGLHDTPLIVLAGENHDVPAHRLHHLAVIDALKNHEPIATAWEDDHNWALREFVKFIGRPPTPEEAADLRDRDRDGTVSLHVLFGICDSQLADHTAKVVSRYLFRHHIPVCLTDAAASGKNLDLADASTAQSLRARFRGFATEIDSTKPVGVQARNHHMAAKAMAFARASGARILIQHCGSAHIAGNEKKMIYPEHSLAAELKALDAPVLALLPLEKEFIEKTEPEAIGLTAEEFHAVSDLPVTKANYTLPPAGNLPDRAAEAAYVNQVLTGVGLPDEMLSPRQYEIERRASALDTKDIFRACAAAPKPGPAAPAL